DVRRTLGVGRIAWGLRATLDGSNVTVTAGVAFTRDGLRLALDSDVSVPISDGEQSELVVLLAPEYGDREALRLFDVPTVLTVQTIASVGPGPAPDSADSIAIAVITQADGEREISQDSSLFLAYGGHGHTGEHFQDVDGRWHWDGAQLDA